MVNTCVLKRDTGFALRLLTLESPITKYSFENVLGIRRVSERLFLVQYRQLVCSEHLLPRDHVLVSGVA